MFMIISKRGKKEYKILTNLIESSQTDNVFTTLVNKKAISKFELYLCSDDSVFWIYYDFSVRFFSLLSKSSA